ncbi:MAG: glucosaminidase domain-containing protein [Pseudomonadales bacterium]|nr:glucosaminidase domain-containing protein [Pseudomonadales bacterium]
MKAWALKIVGCLLLLQVVLVTSPISKIEKEVVIVELEVAPFHPERVSLGDANRYSPPDFTTYSDSSSKKEAFYSYLLPMIHKANLEVIRERQWLSVMADKMLEGLSLNDQELDELSKFEARYAMKARGLSSAERIGSLLLRVDVVPASLVVAQAAKESGWGTSRFATQGNNYFGIWCFYQGCGLTPLRREQGRAHEVATFGSVEQGVRYYVRTINTHVAYNDLRKVRARAKLMQKTAFGEELADGLIRYSERGMAYVREIQSMIRFNKMQRFTRSYSA